MSDLAFVLATLMFFAVAIAYVRGCEKLEVGASMSENALLIILCALLLGYLLTALLKPEKF